MIVSVGGRDDRDVHPLDQVDLRVVDLGEDQLVPETQRVVVVIWTTRSILSLNLKVFFDARVHKAV